MAGSIHPRVVLKTLLDGGVPPRPLFLPIMFSMAARVEDMTQRAFLVNPTKISSSLRRVRTHMITDGLTCYFDPLLEAEALGATLRWQPGDAAANLEWPGPNDDEVSPGLRAPEQAATLGRVPVAVEVIRALKTVIRDTALLVAAVTGP